MQSGHLKDISKFRVAGINYRKADAFIRGQFALPNEAYSGLLEKAFAKDFNEVFVLSTCNRTEIYGFAETALELVELLCEHTAGNTDLFLASGYIKSGYDAIEHLFDVSAGLDSQILGDYEIVGQIKAAVNFAKKHGLVNAFAERLTNTVLQSSKAIKNQTRLSGGTVSVSFAAIQYIRRHVRSINDKKILLVGTGKIGRITCKNLVHYLKTKNITLINRTEEKAVELAREMDLKHAPWNELSQQVAQSDIILVATDAMEPTILCSHLDNRGSKLILDLSIPHNVEIIARNLQHITLINVDDLSKLRDETLARRKAEIPRAKEIIAGHMAEFAEWYEMRKHVPVLKAIKTKLKEIHNSPLFISLYNNTAHTEEKIQKVINGAASKMKGRNQKGCHYIEAINEFIATGTN